MRRRQFLTTVSSALAFGVGASASAAASESGVSRYEGLRVHRYTEKTDGYRHEERFTPKRRNAARALGSKDIKLEEREIPAEAYEEIFSKARKAARRNALALTEHENGFQVEYRDTAVLGSFREFAQKEKEIKQKASAQAGILIDFPTHTYKADDPDDQYDLGEATGPINVGWDTSDNASEVEDKTDGWSPWIYLGGDRYVINDNPDDVKKQDADIGRSVGLTALPDQYHVRLYDVDSETAPVVGQAHRDPNDHNQITGVDDWKFKEAREEICGADPWHGYPYEIDNEYIGNGYRYTPEHTTEGVFSYITY